MKYCLSIGLHNLYFDIAIVSDKHQIIKKKKCLYDRSKDISNNIYIVYRKEFSNYHIESVGVGVSNNIDYKDDFLYKITSFDFKHYNLKQSLYKLFKVDVFIMEETYLASLSLSYIKNSKSLLYVILDNKISNSFVIDHKIINLEEDTNLKYDEKINEKCSKVALKQKLLMNDFDDDYIGRYFLSNNTKCKEIIREWATNLNKSLVSLVNELNVKDIVFAGAMGEYIDEFKVYLPIANKMNCIGVNNYRDYTLIGVSHLIFKDN